MSSPEDKFTVQNSLHPGKNTLRELPTFADTGPKPADWDPAISNTEEESHLTPANLPLATFKLQSTNVSRGSRGSLKKSDGSDSQNGLAINKKINSFDSTPHIPKPEGLHSSIEEQTEENEEDENNKIKDLLDKTDKSSLKYLSPNTITLPKLGLKSGSASSVSSIEDIFFDKPPEIKFIERSPPTLALNVPRRRKLTQDILTPDTSPSPSVKNVNNVKRRTAVYVAKSFTPEQIYFLDNKLSKSHHEEEGKKKVVQRPRQPRKLVEVIASAAAKSNNKTAKTLYDILKKVNPKALEERKRRKKKAKPIYKRILRAMLLVSRRIAEYVLEPDSNFVMGWRSLVMSMTLVDLFYLPFLLSFYYPQYQTEIVWLEYVIFFFFLCAHSLKFNIAYYTKGTLVKNRKKIAKHYFKTYFLVDIITLSISVPRVLFGFYGLIYFEVIRVCRIVFLRRHLTKLEDHMRLSVTWSGILRLLKLWTAMLIIIHFIACIMHKIGQDNDDGESWLDYYGLRDESISRRYCVTVYWAVTTVITVGYGDITPHTDGERIFAMVVMMFAGAVFGYSMNTINIIIEEIDEYKMLKTKKIRRANNYMKMKGLDKDMQTRVRKYLEHNLDEENLKRNIEHDFIGMLHGSLKREVLVEIYGKTLREATIFKENHFTRKFLNDVSQSLTELFLSPEQEIFLEGDCIDQSMYFLMQGKVEIYLKECDKVLKTLGKNSYFGEIAFFTGKPRSASAKSMNFSEVFCLNKERFLRMIRYNGLDKELFHYLKDMVNLYSRYDMLKVRCFNCDELGHVIADCPQLQLNVNKKGIMQQHVRDQERFRKIYQRRKDRYICKRAKIVACAQKIQMKFMEEQYEYEGSQKNMSLAWADDASYISKMYMKQERMFGISEDNFFSRPEMMSPTLLPMSQDPIMQAMQSGVYQQQQQQYIYALKNSYFDPYFMTINFDRVANYEHYFPHNNIQKLMVELEEARENKSTVNKIFKKSINIISHIRNKPIVHAKISKVKGTYESLNQSPTLYKNSWNRRNSPEEEQLPPSMMSPKPVGSRFMTELNQPFGYDNRSMPSFFDLSPKRRKPNSHSFASQMSPVHRRNFSPTLIPAAPPKYPDDIEMMDKEIDGMARLEFQLDGYTNNSPTLGAIGKSAFEQSRYEEEENVNAIEKGVVVDVNDGFRLEESPFVRGMSRDNRRSETRNKTVHFKLDEGALYPTGKKGKAQSESLIRVKGRFGNTEQEIKDGKADIKEQIKALVNSYGSEKIMKTLAEIEGE